MINTLMEPPVADEVHFEGIATVLRDNFRRRGAVTVQVEVVAPAHDRFNKKVRLTHEAFETATLTMEETGLLLHHLHYPSSTEIVFTLAQAIEQKLDTDLVYDLATGRLRTPHARKKEGAA